MWERANTIKHFKTKQFANLSFGKDDSPHPLNSSWTPRPKHITIRSPDIN
jgi:hypothetical protein